MSTNPTVTQIWDSQALELAQNNYLSKDSSATLKYIVWHASDEQEACAAAWKYAPAYLADPSAPQNKIPHASVSLLERCADDVWKVNIQYKFNSGSSAAEDDILVESEDEANGANEVSFECSGATMTLTRAYNQALLFRAEGAPPLPNVLNIPIGWNGKHGANSEIAGVEVDESDTREEYTRRLKYTTVRSIEWRRKIATLRGRINLGKFKGWNPGEARFLGCSYETPVRGASHVTVRFSFSIRPNECSPVVFGQTLPGTIWGHNYIWGIFADTSTSNSGSICKTPKYLFCSQVYRLGDFSQLGL